MSSSSSSSPSSKSHSRSAPRRSKKVPADAATAISTAPASVSAAVSSFAAVALPPATDGVLRAGSFSMKELALAQDFDTALGMQTQIHAVPVRKPAKQSFVRVHSSPDYRMSMAILRDERGDMYAVHPAALSSLADEAKPMMVYTAIDEAGNVFLWPVGLPGSDGRTNAWWQSAHAAATLAQREWVRVVSAIEAGFYKTKTSSVDKGEPKWPALSFEELLQIAFGDGRLIDTPNHPIVRRLNGEA